MADPTTDFGEYLRQRQSQQALEQAVVDQDADKKQAAHSVALSQVFNMPAEDIYGNYRHFVQDQKAAVMENLLGRNEFVRKWINNDPMVTKVGKDDWANIDQFTEALAPLSVGFGGEVYADAPFTRRIVAGTWNYLKQAWTETAESGGAMIGQPRFVPEIPYGQFPVHGDRPWGQQIEEAEKERKRLANPPWLEYTGDWAHPVQGKFWSLDSALINLIASPIMAPYQAARDEIAEQIEERTGFDKETSKLIMDILSLGFAYWQTWRSTDRPWNLFKTQGMREMLPEELQRAALGMSDFLERQEVFLKAGENPKAGLDKITDKLMEAEAKINAETIEEGIKAGEKTEVKELSSQQLADLARIISEQDVSLPYEVAAKLYEGVVRPFPGDQLFGDIPGFAEQFVRNRELEDPIRFSHGELQRLKPEMWRKVKEYISLGDGISIEEGKAASDPARQARQQRPPRMVIEGWGPEEVVERRTRAQEDVEDAAGLRPLRGQPKTPEELVKEGFEGVRPEVPNLFAPEVLVSKVREKQMLRALKEWTNKKLNAKQRQLIAERKRRDTPEWHENLEKEEAQVREDLQNTPIWRFTWFMNSSELAGKKVPRPRLDPAYVWPSQQEHLPKTWMKEGGLKPSEVADLFGYHDGYSLMEDATDFYRKKGSMSVSQFFEKRVKDERDLRMQMKYGEPEDLALERIRGEALSIATRNLIDEETFQLHQLALGVDPTSEPPVSRGNLESMAYEKLKGMKVRETTLQSLFSEAGKLFRATEDAHYAKDPVKAYKLAQKRRLAVEVARQAKEVQKEKASFERIYTRTRKREPTALKSSEGAPYAMYLHDLWRRMGRAIERTSEDLDAALAESGRNIGDFGKDHEFKWVDNDNVPHEGLPGQEETETPRLPNLPVYNKLKDPRYVPTKEKDMTVAEFRGLSGTAHALYKLGSDAHKVGREVERTFLHSAVAEMDAQTSRMTEKGKWEESPGPLEKAFQNIRVMKVGMQKWEFMGTRIDRFESDGPFTRYIMGPLDRMAGEGAALAKERAREFLKVIRPRTVDRGPKQWLPHPGKVDLRAPVENTFLHHPDKWVWVEGKPHLPDGPPAWKLDEENLVTALAYWMDPGSRKAMVDGFMTQEHEWANWFTKVSKPYHWDLARQLSKFIGGMYAEESATHRRMTGTSIPRVPLKDVMTPFKNPDGTPKMMEGGYWPISYDRAISFPAGFIDHPTVVMELADDGFTRPRTGSNAPVRLDLSNLRWQIMRRIDYVTWAEGLVDMQKFSKDGKFNQIIRTRLGEHYMKSFNDFIADIAGRNGYSSAAAGKGRDFLNGVINRWINMEVWGNIPTILKHGGTAAWFALKEAGWKVPIEAAEYLMGINNLKVAPEHTMRMNKKWMYEGDPDIGFPGNRELQSRRRWFGDNPSTVVDYALGRWGPMDIGREYHNYWGMLPFQVIDNFFSELTYITTFKNAVREQMEKGLGWKDAVFAADEYAGKMVRKAHGSLKTTNRSEYMRQRDPAFKDMLKLFGFWNNVTNNLYLTTTKAADVITGKRKDKDLLKDLQSISADYVTYMIWPMLWENLIAPVCGPKEYQWSAGCLAKEVTHGVAGFFPMGREISWALLGHDMRLGGMMGSLPSGAAVELSKAVRGEKKWKELDPGLMGRFGLMGISWASRFGGGNQLGRAWQFYWDERSGKQPRPRTPREWADAFVHQHIRKER